MAEIDRAAVKQYWENAEATVLGPYMMDGFGFPVGAGNFRFRAETRIVRRLVANIRHKDKVLDLGNGVGYWAEEFAGNFSKVVAVEGSAKLFRALAERCAPYANVEPILGNVMAFEPGGSYSLVFSGGLLMYLNESDVIELLRSLAPRLGPDGIILCRESTVRGETVKRDGEYSVIYRSVPEYAQIFKRCGLVLHSVERNEPYVLMQMGCELIKTWKSFVPERFQALWMMGRLTYWSLRLGNPWINRIPQALGIPFPRLENHFFVLGAGPMASG